jgi:hypothetical protein
MAPEGIWRHYLLGFALVRVIFNLMPHGIATSQIMDAESIRP